MDHPNHSWIAYYLYIGLSTAILGLPLTWYLLQIRSSQSSKSISNIKEAASSPTVTVLTGDQDITVVPTIEISVSDIESAYQAWCGGANSLELCSNRSEGGTTPSLGLIEECVSRFQLQGCLEIHVLIRPRPGHFVYSGNTPFTAII